MSYHLVVLLALVAFITPSNAASRHGHVCQNKMRGVLIRNPISRQYGELEYVRIDDNDLMVYCAEGVQYRDFKIAFNNPAIPPLCIKGDFPLSCGKDYDNLEINGHIVKSVTCYDSELNEDNFNCIGRNGWNQTGRLEVDN